MKDYKLFENFEQIFRDFTSWGFGGFLLGKLLKFIFIIPFLFFLFFYSIFQDWYEEYQKEKQSILASKGEVEK